MRVSHDDTHRAFGQQVYAGSTRRGLGRGFCDQPAVPRVLVDEALLGELVDRYIDLDATRHRLEQRLCWDLAAARKALAQAQRESQKAASAITWIERDYIDGEITAEQWPEARPQAFDMDRFEPRKVLLPTQPDKDSSAFL